MKPIIGIVGRTNRVKNNKYNIFVNDNHRRAVIEKAVGYQFQFYQLKM